MLGSGTQSDPYILEDWTDYNQIATEPAAFYKLESDIDFTNGHAVRTHFNGDFNLNGYALLNVGPFRDDTDSVYTGQLITDLNGTIYDGEINIDYTNYPDEGSASIIQTTMNGSVFENIKISGTFGSTDSTNAPTIAPFDSINDGSIVRDIFIDLDMSGYGDIHGFTDSIGSFPTELNHCITKATMSDPGGTATFYGFMGFDFRQEAPDNCFWDETVNPNATDPTSATPKTTSELQTLATYNDTSTAGLDTVYDIVELNNHDGQQSTATWAIDDGVDYPVLFFEVDFNDTTAPTYTTDGTLSIGATDTNSIEITYDEAQDNITAQADIVYRLYRASQGTALDTLSEIDSNGTEVASDTGVASLTDTIIDAGTTYEYNVTAEDEAQNRLAYNQIQASSDTLVGNVTLDGSPVQDAYVSVHTVDGFDMSNFTFVEILQTDSNGDYTVTNYDNTKHYFFSVLYLNEDYSGTAESGSSNTLQDTDQSWGSSEFDDGQSFIEITGGTGSGQIRRITSNTADTVTVEHDWDTNPDATSTYRIGVAYSDESRFVQSKD